MCICFVFYYDGSFSSWNFNCFAQCIWCGILIYITKRPESIEFWQGCKRKCWTTFRRWTLSLCLCLGIGTRPIKYWANILQTNKTERTCENLHASHRTCYCCCCCSAASFLVHKTGSVECTECTKFVYAKTFYSLVFWWYFSSLSFSFFTPKKNIPFAVRFMHSVYGWKF